MNDAAMAVGPLGLPRMLSVQEVADQLGVGESTVYRMIRKKLLPAVDTGGLYRIWADEFSAWLHKQRTMPGRRKVIEVAVGA